MEKAIDKNFTFDFSGKKEDAQRKEEIKQKEIKFKSFKKMGIFSVVSVLTIALVGFGGKTIYENIQEATNKSIAEKELIIKLTPKIKIVELIERERDVVKSTFAKNEVLLTNYANYRELVDVLTLGSSLASKKTANSKIQRETLTLLDYDQKAVDKVFHAASESRDVKKDVFLTGDSMSKFTKWSANVKNNEFMYAGGIIALNKDIEKELIFLDVTQKDIIKTVQDKIKAKDFNLDKAQKILGDQVSSDASSEISTLRKVQNEIAGTAQSNLLTDKDIAQAELAMTDLEKEAKAKIKQDRETVEKMIASASPAPVTNNQVQSSPQVSSNSWGFAEYYLLYSWMNSGSNSSYNSGYNAGVKSQNMPTPTAAILSKGSANMYSIKKEDSYLNKSIDRKPVERVAGVTVDRPNISLLRSRLDFAKQKAQQAATSRKESIVKMASESKGEAKKVELKANESKLNKANENKLAKTNESKVTKLSLGSTSSGSSSGTRSSPPSKSFSESRSSSRR